MGKEFTVGILEIKIQMKNFPQNNQQIQVTLNFDFIYYCALQYYIISYFTLFLFNQTVHESIKHFL